MRRTLGLLLAAILAFTLSACGQPVPPDKRAYVGDWRAPEMRLAISADGRVVYKRVKGSGSTSMDVPLKRFEGDNFVVGVGPMSTTFIVSVPPRLDDGVWTMTVDGVRLMRKQGMTPDLAGPGVDT